MYKLVFFVPIEQLEAVKAALFAAGGGRIGHYDCCAWQVLGLGQFRPRAGSNPFLGSQEQLEQVQEYRVEMVVADALIEPVIRALHAAHPYEEPAYDVWRLEDFSHLTPA